MTYQEIKNKAFQNELQNIRKTASAGSIIESLAHAGVNASARAAERNPGILRSLLRGIGGSISETGSHLLNFAKNPIRVGGKNLNVMVFGGLKPGAGMLEKIFFNPVTQGYFMGYLPLKSAYDIYNEDSKHKGERWGQWLGSQAGILAVPMTANLVPAIAANVALTAIGRKAGELIDNAMLPSKVRYAAPRTEERINDQLSQARVPVY